MCAAIDRLEGDVRAYERRLVIRVGRLKGRLALCHLWQTSDRRGKKKAMLTL